MERILPPMRWSDGRSASRRYTLAEIWAYRELILAFVVRDFHVRYRQTVIGVAWVILQPICYTIVFAGFFMLLRARPGDDSVNSILLQLSGAIIWQAFAQSVQQSTLCLANNRQLITKTYFPRLLLPISAVSTPLIDFAIGWCVLLIASICFGAQLSVWILITPLIIIPLTCVSLSVGIWVSMLNALYRDISSLVPMALQMGMVCTPVMYQTSKVLPDQYANYRLLAAINPLVTIIDCFRSVWFGQSMPSLGMILVSALSVGVTSYFGLRYFAKTEDIVADRV